MAPTNIFVPGVPSVGKSRRRVLGISGTPAPTPSIAIDFTTNTATVNGVSTPISNLLSITRASTQTVVDTSGNYTTASSGALAISNAGLQIYPATTNLVLQSQALNNASWTLSHVSVADNTGVAPDGTSTASTFTADGVSAAHLFQQSVTFANNTDYVLSIHAKMGTNRFLQMTLGGSAACVNVDLQTGAVNCVQSAGGTSQGTNVVLGVKALPNGWYRIAWMFRGVNTMTSVAFEITSSLGAPRNNAIAASGNINVWGIQLEASRTVSPYIPTTTATVTRAADNISLTGALATALAASAGTVVMAVTSAVQGSAATFLDANGTVLLGKTEFDNAITASGSSLGSFSASNWYGAVNTMSLGWDAGGGTIQLNGDSAKTDAVARNPVGTFKLGSTGGTSNFFGGNVTSLTVYTSKISQPATLATPMRSFNTLTAYGSNPIIPYNTNAANTVSGDTVYPNLANKIGSTYYALSQASNSALGTANWGAFNLYTSTDLVNWTLHGASPVISGVASTWKNNYLGHPAVINIGGTWYCYYSGRNAAGTIENIGVATSPDFVTWTDYGSNPIVVDNVGIPAIIQIGSTLYLYAADRNTSFHSISYYTTAASTPFGPWVRGGFAIQTLANDWFGGNGRLNDPYVIKNPQGYYEMLFTVENFQGVTPYTKQCIGYAISTDGINWTKLQSPILMGSSGGGIGGAPNNQYPGDAVLLVNGSTASVYWGGDNASTVAQGLLATIT